MNDPVSVQVLAAKDDLPKIVAGFGLRQCFPPLVQLQERLVGVKRGGMRAGNDALDKGSRGRPTPTLISSPGQLRSVLSPKPGHNQSQHPFSH